ncbi:MAG: flagellar protein [Lachnospiraceae bacterium]|nr:flagellar protein [Lachnospiraceae bacterium]
MRIQNGNYPSALQVQDQFLNQNVQSTPNGVEAKNISFQDILKAKTAGEAMMHASTTLKFSKHAASRLADRQITLSDSQIARLSDGTQKAGAKGIRESLVLMDQLAFIVNVPSATVITAMDQTETNENVFTNIDGAVII